jgi:hypothetical protein
MMQKVKKKLTEQEVQRAYREALRRYIHRDNVTGVDVGFKYVDDQPTDSIAVRIHVKEKIAETALEAAEIFPDEINGVPVDVIPANYHINMAPGPGVTAKPAAETSMAPRAEARNPIQPGISVGHPDVTFGTIGCFVRDTMTGKLCILSNWHVLAGTGAARPGDPITQPGRDDRGRVDIHTVANLEKMMLDEDGDAAIATLNGRRQIALETFETGVVFSGLRMPRAGEILAKSGRRTGVTFAKVDGVGRYKLDYPVGPRSIDGFKLVARQNGNPDDEEISAGGDSGAIWYSPDSREAVGLHFAGETDSNPAAEYALACFTPRVFSRLHIELVATLPRPETAIADDDLVSALAAQLGSVTTAQVAEVLGIENIMAVAQDLQARYPLLRAIYSNISTQSGFPEETGSLGSIAIGYAAGAVAKLINVRSNGNYSPENFTSMILAFLAGAATAARRNTD